MLIPSFDGGLLVGCLIRDRHRDGAHDFLLVHRFETVAEDRGRLGHVLLASISGGLPLQQTRSLSPPDENAPARRLVGEEELLYNESAFQARVS